MLGCALLTFFALEAALQIRSHIRYGQSVFNVLTEETRYVIDKQSGLNTLRPNHVFRSEQMEIRTNDHGLRSEPVSSEKPPQTYRIAVVGASTVMGALAPTNESTFSYRLEHLLNHAAPKGERHYEVINAGIAGYGLRDQARMIEKVILPLHPDLIIVYPGFNDFGIYCKSGSNSPATPPATRQPLHRLGTPSWLLSVELIQKNTVGFRTPPASQADFRSPSDIDLGPYRTKLATLSSIVKKAGIPLLLATNARSYRPEQPREEQLELSETARFYNPCFDLEGLNALYDLHNSEIASAAEAHDAYLVPLGDLIPGGKLYFVDASHFSNAGEELAAHHLHQFLLAHILTLGH